MLSIHDNGHYGPGGSGAAGCASYYELVTREDREALACGAPRAPTPGESEGIWYSFGTAPASLYGQRGTPADLRAALAGDWRGQAVRNAYAESRFMSWDLTFSAFKSASVAFAAADAQHRAQIQDAVRDAALTAFREALVPEIYIRRGHGGCMRESVAGIAAHAYLQTQSRANDPQLHMHVIVPSFAWAGDGRVHTIEMRDVYASKLAAGAVFQAELSSRLQDLGYVISRDANGVVRVGAVDPRLEELFSQRARQIEAELEKRLGPEHYEDASSGQRALIAELTRPHHDLAWREDWASRAEEAGLRQEWERAAYAHEMGRTFARLVPSQLVPTLDSLARAAAHDVIFGVERSALTNKEWLGTAVGRLHRFIGELAARSVGTGAAAHAVLSAAARAIERGVVVTLEHASSPAQARITTPEMIAVEQRLLYQWRELLTRGGHQVAPQDVEHAILRWEAAHNQPLSAAQKTAVHTITSDGAIAVVVGAAGSGKTAALEVARDAYERAGYHVRGESWTAVAKDAMARQAGIVCQTMAAAEVGGRALGGRTITIVDEAAMVPATHLQRLVTEVAASGGKLVLVGDERQLQPLGPGATFGHLAREAAQQAAESSSAMQEILRQQRAPQEVKEIAALAAAGRPDAALRRADGASRVWIHAQHDAMLRAAARDIVEGLIADKDTMGLVPTRSEAAQLNAMIREELRARGILPSVDVRYAAEERESRHGIALAVGDRVAFTTNDYHAGVYNGMRGAVIGISPVGDVSVKLDEGYQRVGHDGTVCTDPVVVRDTAAPRAIWGSEAAQYVNVPADQVAQRTSEGYTYLSHDYARTLPRAQGATVDLAVVAAHVESHAFCRQWGTVAFTSHREDVQVHLSAAGRGHDRAMTYEPGHWPREIPMETFAGRVQHAAAEPNNLSYELEPAFDDKVRAEALDEAASRLAQDRPGPSTQDYRAARQGERGREIGDAGLSHKADQSEERAPDFFARKETTVEDRAEAASEDVGLEPELAIEGGRI
jgi:conjugative relaxase-like TrwC/TraI family protein